MSIFSWDSSTSTSSTSRDHYYGYTMRDRYKKVSVKKSDSQRPLSELRLKEEQLKEEQLQDQPSGGMPEELILFDPKELVLGGKNK